MASTSSVSSGETVFSQAIGSASAPRLMRSESQEVPNLVARRSYSIAESEYSMDVLDDGIPFDTDSENGENDGDSPCYRSGFTLPNGEIEIGVRLNNTTYWNGTFKFNDGSYYSGDWENGTMHGYGMMHYADGGIYYGNWSNNLRHGEGDMTYSNRTTYIGNWKYDKPNGYGSRSMENGTVFDGDWLDGVKHGHGIISSPLGTRCAQVYMHGILMRSNEL
jgi:hypothetical protein